MICAIVHVAYLLFVDSSKIDRFHNGAILAPITIQTSCITPSIARDGDDGGSDGGGDDDDDETAEATMAVAAATTTTSPNLPGNLAGGSGAG